MQGAALISPRWPVRRPVRWASKKKAARQEGCGRLLTWAPGDTLLTSPPQPGPIERLLLVRPWMPSPSQLSPPEDGGKPGVLGRAQAGPFRVTDSPRALTGLGAEMNRNERTLSTSPSC